MVLYFLVTVVLKKLNILLNYSAHIFFGQNVYVIWGGLFYIFNISFIYDFFYFLISLEVMTINYY